MTDVREPAALLAPLVEDVARILQQAATVRIDELHIAAVLESRGINDQAAADEYGHDDVFTLATVVARALPPADVVVRQDAGSGLPSRSKTLAHGPLYIMPCVVYPAILEGLGPTAMLYGLVSATAVGWVWGMGMSAAAYQLRGQAREQAAGQALRLLGAVGTVLGFGAGALLTDAGLRGRGLAAFVTFQVAFMLASGVLVFYEREVLLAVLAGPAVVTGICDLVPGFSPALADVTVFLAATSVVLMVGAAWQLTGRAGRDVSGSDQQQAGAGPVRPAAILRGSVPSVIYACLCAWFLLFTDARFFDSSLGLAAAAAPLVLGMGTVEWRAHSFAEHARRLMGGQWSPEDFQHEIWRLLIRELGACVLALAGLALAFLTLVSGKQGGVTPQEALLVDTHVLLGCAFFLCFVLARQQRFGTVLVILSVVVVMDVVLVTSGVAHLSPVGAVEAFLWSTVALLVFLLAGFHRGLRHVHQHYC